MPLPCSRWRAASGEEREYVHPWKLEELNVLHLRERRQDKARDDHRLCLETCHSRLPQGTGVSDGGLG